MAALARRPVGATGPAENDIYTVLLIIATLFIVIATVMLGYQFIDFYGLEYRFVGQYLQGQLNRNDPFQKLNSAIHQFAKRQETWFRRMERQGVVIHWLEGDADPVAEMLAACQDYAR